MIISKLSGGLGNQIFEYAAGRRLSVIHNSELILDISHYTNDPKRQYDLEPFNIRAKTEKTESKNLVNNYIKEKHFEFDPEIIKLPDNTLLDGYWQSYKYFEDIEDVIREEITLTNGLPENLSDIQRMMQSVNSVSLHIRRGDYVSELRTNKFHGTCSIDYYERGAALIAEKTDNPHFFIFSDDIAWVKKNLVLPYPMTFVSNPSYKSSDELILMSNANHFIIANSTFSWWGAWLGRSDNKTVLAPKKWFANEKINISDIIPSSWTKI